MTQAANTYAQALYDLAKDENLGKIILEELALLKKVFTETLGVFLAGDRRLTQEGHFSESGKP